MMPKHALRWTVAAASVAFFSLGIHSCAENGLGTPFLFFRAPLLGQLSLPQGIELDVHLSVLVDSDSLVVKLDGVPIPAGATLPDVSEGRHVLRADAELGFFGLTLPIHAATAFDAVDLERPDECEILNNASCYLPFPSSRFFEEVGSETETGVRANFPEWTIPNLIGPNEPLDPTQFNFYDGVAPTVQILAHLPGADPEVSGASRLLPAGAPQSPPFVGVRTHDESSLDPDSPTVLIDADTGERVLHWVEVDDHAVGNPDRQVLFMRPAQALVPGHRYIVAFRNMLDANGDPIPPEPVFRALRNGFPSTIQALEDRRAHHESLFEELGDAGVPRYNLQLAFDFVVRSEKQLHERMLFMRDDALAWLEGLAPTDTSAFDNISIQNFGNCTDPAQNIWKKVSGQFYGPYYMDGNINDIFDVVFLNVDENNMPVRVEDPPVGFNWSVAIPCTVFRGEAAGNPLLLGHGFLGDGAGMVDAFVSGGFFGGQSDVPFIAGATDWRGLALGFMGPDAVSILLNLIGTPTTGHKFNNTAMLPHRLMQGMVNTLVLSRMMKNGFFNRLPAFRRNPFDPSTGVMPVDEEMFYFGVSLGGIMGTFYAGLNQDTIRHNIDVPAMNFSILEQRSTQFPAFLDLLEAIGLTDPMDLVIVLQLQHEIWVSAGPSGYVRNITGTVDPPLPDTPAKKLLMTVAFLDKQVSNQAAEIMARSLGIPNLVGSVQAELPAIPDVEDGVDGLDSALVIYHVGDLDIFDPAHEPFIPPLANQIPSSVCDPHGGRRLSIPASIEQLGEFLRPGGKIFNFCDGYCDGVGPQNAPPQACDPLAP